MCSLFRQIMENNNRGDLADIVRASGGGVGGASGGGSCSSGNNQISSDWQFPSSTSSGILEPAAVVDNFGDPFSSTRDPLLHELNIAAGSPSGFFDSANNNNNSSMDIAPAVKMNIVENEQTSTVCSSLLAQRIMDEEMNKIRPCNIFSRMLQISPNTKMIPVSPHDLSVAAAASPRGTTTTSTTTSSSSLVVNDMIKASSSTGCSVDNSGLQISSPRNTCIKRRKSQAKKVVCIPAPAAANSRPSGEVVPSDLWAWRKYGQKPIKGSPYPRGYYRCSSSKGCSARKQVERSRTDPNMLVITYTSEHNHPWPTQRNALAGSTRSQPTKSINAGSSSAKIITSPSSTQSTPKHTNLLLKEEEHKENNNDDNSSSSVVMAASGSMVCSVKEEMGETTTEKQRDDDDHMCDIGVDFSPRFHESYGLSSSLPIDGVPSIHPDDFFADLGELGPDPLNLLFSPQGFNGEKSSDEKRDNNNKQLQALDPFSLFDWTGINNNSFDDDQESSRRGRGL